MTLTSRLMIGAGLLALSTGFAAAAPATVQNDLNLRSGPGPDYDVIAAMPAGSTVNVMGCQASWCRVAFGGTVGFASRGYLGLGGPVAAAPAYGESYAPAYGYADSYAYERRFGDDGAVRGERRVGEDTTMRRERSSRERRAAPARGLNDNANARSNGNATTGAAPSSGTSDNDHGPNFIGPGKSKVDNH